jgi:cysteinyl-tRNA synthetase
MGTMTQPVSRSANEDSLPAKTIRVYNTLSKTKEPFETLVPGRVGIYLCGPTVYKPSHIGHMVGPVILDAITRYLRYSGYEVTLVINITDIDDKLIVESQARGIPLVELAREMTADYFNNLQKMRIDTVSHFPRATENIDEILAITSRLVDQGFAYVSGGDVYFDVTKFPQYGKLSHRSVESMQGEGGDMGDRKRSPADFALWKSAKPGEPSWDSPWGPGRPGWHIECSAMSRRYLGESFDIHGGGLDLVFPHHENEIAQSECCHGKPMAKYWLHNGLMQAADEVGKVGGRSTRTLEEGDQAAQEAGKMGKSKGASPFRELLARHSPESIRFFLLSTHYRRPIYFSDGRIREVATGLETFYRFFQRFERVTGEPYYCLPAAATRSERGEELDSRPPLPQVRELRSRFLESMDDDFNSGGAIGDLFELVRCLNKFVDDAKLEGAGKQDADKVASLRQGTLVLRELSATLGLFREPPEASASPKNELIDKLMAIFIEMRADARKNKDFATADRIRKSLAAIGVTLQDRADGTGWTLE